jgi:hypothetical protein
LRGIEKKLRSIYIAISRKMKLGKLVLENYYKDLKRKIYSWWIMVSRSKNKT